MSQLAGYYFGLAIGIVIGILCAGVYYRKQINKWKSRLADITKFCNTDGSPCDGFRFRENVIFAKKLFQEEGDRTIY